MTLTSKIITTGTAEIVGAGRAEFKTDESVQQLVSRPGTEAAAAASEDTKPKIVKTFGDLRVEVNSLRIVNGYQYLLSMTLTNLSAKKSVWVAVSTDLATNPKAVISSENGNEFRSSWNGISGVAYAAQQHGGFFQATEIQPRDSVSATVRFASHIKKPTAGQCGFNLELLAGTDFDGSFGPCRSHNVTGRVEVR